MLLSALVSELELNVRDVLQGLFALKSRVGEASPGSALEEKGPIIEGTIGAEQKGRSCTVRFRFPEKLVSGMLAGTYGARFANTAGEIEEGVGEITNVVSTRIKGRLNNSGHGVRIGYPQIRRLNGTEAASVGSYVSIPVETKLGAFQIFIEVENESCVRDL